MNKNQAVLLSVIAITAVAAAYATIHRPESGSDKSVISRERASSPRAAAETAFIGTVEHRFHDLTDASFGYERVIQAGKRMHNQPPFNLFPPFDMEQAPPKTTHIEPYGEVTYDEYWSLFKPDTASEMQSLRAIQAQYREVTIYTVGEFEKSAVRVNGPARATLASHSTSDVPTAESLTDTFRILWQTGDARSELDRNGWRYVATRVFADQKACLKCHNSDPETGTRRLFGQELKLGDAVGLLVIGFRTPMADTPDR